jgi:hypothetical protein
MSFSFRNGQGSAWIVLWRFGGWHAVTLGCLVLSALAFSVYALTYKSKRKGVESVNNNKLIRKFAFQ